MLTVKVYADNSTCVSVTEARELTYDGGGAAIIWARSRASTGVASGSEFRCITGVFSGN